jgi:hypothetical protein
MSTRIHKVSSKVIKTNLGFNFNPSEFSHMESWSSLISDWDRLSDIRLQRTQDIFDRDPSRWTGLIGDVYGSLDKFKSDVGVRIVISSLPFATSSYYDSYEKINEVCVIEKIGRGKWKKIDIPL